MRRIKDAEILSGVGSCVLGLCVIIILTFLPVNRVLVYDNAGTHAEYFSLIDNVNGLGNFVRFEPAVAVALLLSASSLLLIASSAWFHAVRKTVLGAVLVWISTALWCVASIWLVTHEITFRQFFVALLPGTLFALLTSILAELRRRRVMTSS